MSFLRLNRPIEIDAPPERVWPLLADTDRINRALKLPPVSYGQPDASLIRPAQAKFFGLVTIRWDEPPFEWVENRFYSVRRKFHTGPISEMSLGLRLKPHPEKGKSLVQAFSDLDARGSLGYLAAKALGTNSLAKLAELCRGFAQAVANGGRAFPRRPPSGLNEMELGHRLRTLKRRVDPAALERLSRHVREGADEELVRMRPFPLADRWDFDRLELLRAFLHACRAGVLDLTWEVLCPNCRISKGSYTSLSHLRHQAHCETCNIVFDSEFDRNVEARFTVNPAVRTVRQAVFCLGGPGNTPHRRAQLLVQPGSLRSEEIDLPHRHFKLRSLRGEKFLALKPQADAGSAVRMEFRSADPGEDESSFKPGRLTLSVRNASDSPLWVVMDEQAWSEQGATAALVTTLQEFRDLFSSDAISPGEEASIRSLAILFTDLKDSTPLYEKIGSSAAYALVRDHFEILRRAASAHGGSVVKTIGDAVMAVFSTATDALRAALDMHEGVWAYNRSRPGQEPIVLKIGLHSGPVIAIDSNGSLDYFGTTVNVAARVQSQSAGEDVVLSEAVYLAEGVQALLRERASRTEPFTIRLKGLSDQFRLWRAEPKK